MIRRAGSLSTKQLGGGAALLALLASAFFGGLEETQEDVPVAEPGEAITADPFEVTISRAATAVSLTEQIPDSVNGRYLLVFVQVTNLSDAPVGLSDLTEVVRLESVPGLLTADGTEIASERAAPVPYHADDSSRLGVVSPGMSYHVAFLWEQAAGAPAPTELTLEVYAQTWTESSLQEQWSWEQPVVTATVPVTVDPWQAPEAEAEEGTS